jgi:hypothetical protein
MEKGEKETLDESSIIKQESVLLKVEKACKIQVGKVQIEVIKE